jgi:hypothetical protein
VQYEATPFIRGIWTPLSTAVIPASARIESNNARYLPPGRGSGSVPASRVLQVHREVAYGLGHPSRSRMRGRTQDPDAPAGVLDHRQDVPPRPGQGHRFESRPRGWPRPASVVCPLAEHIDFCEPIGTWRRCYCRQGTRGIGSCRPGDSGYGRRTVRDRRVSSPARSVSGGPARRLSDPHLAYWVCSPPVIPSQFGCARWAWRGGLPGSPRRRRRKSAGWVACDRRLCHGTPP